MEKGIKTWMETSIVSTKVCESSQWFWKLYKRKLMPWRQGDEIAPKRRRKAPLLRRFPNLIKPGNQKWPEICQHEGPCDANSKCYCYLNEAPCRPDCFCEDKCKRRFPSCRCEGPCLNCECIEYGRECDPGFCQCHKCGNDFANVSLPRLGVWKSSLPGAQKGLFAMQDIKKNTFLGFYYGERVRILDNVAIQDPARITQFETSKGRVTR
jgi:hypothetical protein